MASTAYGSLPRPLGEGLSGFPGAYTACGTGKGWVPACTSAAPASWASRTWDAALPRGGGPPDAQGPGASATAAPGWRAGAGPPSRQSLPRYTAGDRRRTENSQISDAGFPPARPTARGRTPRGWERTAHHDA